MAVILRELIREVPADQKLTLLAGEAGLNHMIRWVHMVESIEISTFLDGGEIAFTTGIALGDETELLDLVRENVENNAGGMVVNIGPYISRVPNEVIAYCNDQKFPLFSVPWETHMAQIMRLFSTRILQSDQAAMELSAAAKNALYFSNQPELYVPALERNGFQSGWSYCVAAIEEEGQNEQKTTSLLRQLENQLAFAGHSAFCLENSGQLLLFFANTDESSVRRAMDEIIRDLTVRLRQTLYIGVGRLTQNIYCVAKSYRQATRACKLYHQMGRKNQCAYYPELGVYKILLAMEDLSPSKAFYTETLGKLEEYDQVNGSDYLATLRCYLQHSGRVNETAQALFVHRNTVNYKMGKISEILERDLSDLNTRFDLQLAFYLQDILQSN